MRQTLKLYSLGIALLGILSSCANETSDSDRKREKQQRLLERLRRAEGVFSGFIDSSQTKIPVSIEITTLTNPQNNDVEPILQASADLGFFGGVRIASEKTYFDANTGEFNARFGALELKGFIDNDQITQVVLSGPQDGQKLVKLKRETALHLWNIKRDYNYFVGNSDGLPMAVLTIEKWPGAIESNETSDLPLFPALTASLKFLGTGAAIHNSVLLEYDPLKNKMEILWDNKTRMVIDRLDFSGELDSAIQKLSGRIVFGASTIANFDALLQDQIDLSQGVDLPPETYIGLYQSSTDGVLLPAIAKIEYEGDLGRNQGDLPFTTFPNLRLNVNFCHGPKTFLQLPQMNLESVDYLSNKMRFRSAAPSQSDLLEIDYTSHLSTLSGRFFSANEANRSDRTFSHLKLFGLKKSSAVSCDNLDRMIEHELDESLRKALQAPLDPFSKGAFSYQGMAIIAETKGVPAHLEMISLQEKSGQSEVVSLGAILDIGFFGGVRLASNPLIYDFATGHFSASFPRQSGPPLELKGRFGKKNLNATYLQGPNLGRINLDLATGRLDTITKQQVFPYDVFFNQEQEGSKLFRDGYLQFKRHDSNQTGSYIHDLPELPGLLMSIQFESLGDISHVPRTIIYDPLQGQMDIYQSQEGWIRIGDLYSDFSSKKMNPHLERLNGQVYFGSKKKYDIHLLSEVESIPITENFPPVFYSGVYKNLNGLTYRAIGFLEPIGGQGQNPDELIFNQFPLLRLEVWTCNSRGDRIFRRIAELKQLDYVQRQGIFESTNDSNSYQLVIENFSRDWQHIGGFYRNRGAPANPGEQETLELSYDPAVASKKCKF